MKSRERFLAALYREKVDRAAVGHVTALTTVELQDLCGCYMPGVHHDPAGQVKLLGANHEVLGFDAVSFLTNYFNAPAALGIEMDWGDPRRYPTYKSPLWHQKADAVVPEDFLDREVIKMCLETLRIAKRDHGDEIAVLGKVMGPLSMVQVMGGVEQTMMDMVAEPGKIAGFLEVALEILVKFANAQFEMGIDAVSIGEGGAGANMLSPGMYEQMLLGVHEEMISRIKGPVIMHICGDIMPRLDMLERTGMTCFNFDWAVGPKEMAQASAGKFSIMGNINTTDLLYAEPSEIERQVIENLQGGVDIISPGCAISPLCSNRNLRAISEAVEKW